MKIYFEDGPLHNILSEINGFDSELNYYIVNASVGVSSCMNSARYIQKSNPSATIYTNCLELFHNEYAWNEELKVPEVYIRHKDSGKFVRIDEGTNRELKSGHNLAKLYLAGEFDSITNALDNPPRFGFDR